MSEFYVYVYLDPRKPGSYIYGDLHFDFEPFYVGQGHRDRDTQHLRDLFRRGGRKNTYKDNKLKAILQVNLTPIILHLDTNLSQEEARNREITRISQIGRLCTAEGPLTNLHVGGYGGAQPSEVRKKIGVKISQRHKEGVYDKKNSTPMSDEQKEKIRQAHLGKPLSEEHKKAIVESRRGYKHSEETKQKIRESHHQVDHAQITKESWSDPEVAQKRKAAISRAYKEKRESGVKYVWVNDGETSGKYEEAQAAELLSQGWVRGRLPLPSLQGRKLSEEHKQKMRDTAALPEKQKRRSENTKANWQREEYKQKRLESLQKTVQSRSLEKKVWVHKGDEKAFMVVEKDLEEYLAKGYVEGRGKIAVRGKQGKSTWVNNGIESKMLREDKALILLEQGWVRGRLALNTKHST